MQKTQVLMVDDLDETTDETVRTIQFMLDGSEYEMELCFANAEGLRKSLAGYVEKARRIGGTKGRKRTPATPARLVAPAGSVKPLTLVPQTTFTAPTPAARNVTYKSSDVRDWAKSRRLPIKDHGRIPADVYDQYHQWMTTRTTG